MNNQTTLKGFFSDFRLRRKSDGQEIPFMDRLDNLITNSGLDMPATYSWYGCFSYLSIGSGATPATYTDTALEDKIGHTNTYSGTENGRSFDSATKTVSLWTTFVYSGSDTQNITFREMSVGPTSTAIFNRVVFSSNATLPAGYDLIVKYTLQLRFVKYRAPVAATVAVGSTSVAGTMMIQDLSSNGSNFLDMLTLQRETHPPCYFLEPSGGSGYANCFFFTSQPPVLTSLTYDLPSRYGGSKTYNMIPKTYVNGNYYVDRVMTIPAYDYPATTCYGWGFSNMGTNPIYGSLFRANAGFVKPATDTWAISDRLSWGRA